MLSLLLIVASQLACVETPEEITPTPKENTENVGGNVENKNAPNNPNEAGKPPGSPQNQENTGNVAAGGPSNGSGENIGNPNGGENIGPAVLPENGENIGDPGPPPEGGGEMTNLGPPPAEEQAQQGGAIEPQKLPPTFIYNAQSQDSGPLYKSENGTCFVRVNWDKPPNGTLGPTEARDCPQQMVGDHWDGCVAGRLVKQNVGDRKGTCQCEPIEGEPKDVSCPKSSRNE